jgi:glucose/arabinose dehydrogenase
MRIAITLAVLTATIHLSAQNDLVLQLVLDRYGDETTWELRNAANTVIGSGGPYQQFASNGEYPQPPVNFNALPDGGYTFTVFDVYGDGMCCAYGNGSYTLTHVGSSAVVASGGSFGFQETSSFELPPPPPPAVVETPLTVQLEQVASGFSQVTDISNAGDERLFIVQRGGAIRIIDGDGTTLPTPFLTVSPILTTGSEQGLLSLVFHPNYAQNGYLYVNYTASGIGPSGHSRVSRFTVSADPNVVDPASEVVLYTLAQPYSNHNGGDMEFGPDGYLYVGFGDGGSANDPQNFGQNHGSALGTMIRIDVDGGEPFAIPADNPFVNTNDTLPEIWATGLRNPWRFAFDELNGDLYIADVGQNAREEVNHVEGSGPGLNYGWRCYEGNANFNLSGCLPASEYVFPVWDIAHSSGWCSITGGRVYRGSEFPRLQGMYMFSDFCAGPLRAIRRNAGGTWDEFQLLNSGLGQASTFGTDHQNALYVARLNGFIYRITDVCTAEAPTLELQDSVLVSSQGGTYVWTLDGEVIEDATGAEWTVESDGVYQVYVEVNEGCVLASNPVEVIGVGIARIERPVDIVIRPNPATDHLFISGIPADAKGWTAEVRDNAGRLVMTLTGNTVRDAMVLDVAGLTQGAYLLVLRDQAGRVRSGNRFALVR